MKALITLLLIITINICYGQSFHHKKMKKVKSDIGNCQALEPRTPLITKLNHKKLYSHKRKQAKRKPYYLKAKNT